MKGSPQETMPTAIQLQIISNTPGRLRLRVPQQHRQPHAIAQISSILNAVFHEVCENNPVDCL